MRLRTAVIATVLAAIAVLGGSGIAAADGPVDDALNVVHEEATVVHFGDLVLD
ncbi:hypothetical protein ACWFRJ_01655 [Streptomyces sp. NPDC055239]